MDAIFFVLRTGCQWNALRDRLLLKKVVEHAAHQHGVSEVAPELAARVKAAIKSEAAAE